MKIFNSNDDNLQYEFLPAALEIAETPPSPLGRAVIWIIFLIIVSAIIWACIGKIDVVAVARGKVIPDGRLKVVQPLEEGVVTAINVNEGERVTVGQPLIELDSTMKKADITGLEKSLNTAKLERELLRKAIDGGDIVSLVSQEGLADEIKNDLLKLSQSKDSEYNAKQEALNLSVSQSEAGLQAELSNKEKIESNISMLKQNEKSYKELYDKGAIAKTEWEKVYNELILAEKELQVQMSKVEQQKIGLEQAKKNLDSLKGERDTSASNLVVENDKKITELETELAKVQRSIQLQALNSPVNGIVHGIVSNTIGGVVTPAQSIMTIVPDGTPLVIEALLLNKDIGFVTVGQQVAVKFDAFPFQKYGTVKGKVVNISPDAFEDEKSGSVYRMKITLEKSTINVSGKEARISPGMTVTTEIMTGKRRVIEFFLEPIIKYVDESLKLR